MNLFAPNVIDGYKAGHRTMFLRDTAYAYGNLTARADRLFLKSVSASQFWDHKVVWFGLQGILQELKELWDKSFFSQPKEAVVRRYKRRMDNYLGAGKVPTDGMAALHDLGYLPIQVLALPEGSRVNMNVPLYVIYNTHPDFFWFTNYLETSMSALIWKQVTNATIAYEYRRVLEHWAELTGSSKEFIDVQGHDFSYRGAGGIEDGARASSAHLTSFCGTDTVSCVDYVEDYYGANVELEFVAGSIPATEHAVATANILTNLHRMLESRRDDGLPDLSVEEFKAARLQAEAAFVKRLITEVYPDGAVSLVCDSFDFWGVLTDVLPPLREVIMARPQDSLGLAKVVVRPDSGDPVEVICGAEIFDQEEAEFMMSRRGPEDGRQKQIFFLDATGNLKLATDVLNKNQNRLWSEIEEDITLAADVAKFRDLTANLRKKDAERLPHGYHLLVDGFSDLQQTLGFLKAHNVAPTYNDTGLYMRGYKITDHVLTPEQIGAVELLWNTFGGTYNAAGFRELDSHIGLIYGDSITVQRTNEIMRRLAKKQFAASNVVLGIGSYTYQYNTRDTFGQAIKATAIQVGNDLIDLYKAPATEGETAKKSAKGFLRVERNEAGDFVLAQEQSMTFSDLEYGSGELRSVFKNGEFTDKVTLGQIRSRLRAA